MLPSHEDKEEVIQKLGNLNVSGRSPIISKEVFIPTRSWGVAVKVLKRALQSPINPAELSSSDSSATYDLIKVGALKRESALYIALFSVEDLELKVKEIFSHEPYTLYWNLVKDGIAWEEAMSQAFNVNKLSSSVRKDYGRKLASWGRKSGYLSQGRLKSKAKSSELSLFDSIEE